jgi:hypothetical protein
MGGSFETSDDATSPSLQTLRVAALKGGVWEEAKNLADDLPGWHVLAVDEERGSITCRRDRGFLGGSATVVITVSGPDGMPSTTVHVKSTSEGGLLSRDKANVAEFMGPFHRRVC